MIPQAIAIINGKGGVGKTSTAANLAGELAADGHRVLLVDYDVQGNLRHDLGIPVAHLDRGRALAACVLGVGTKQSFTDLPVRDVRPNLDVVVGGRELEGLVDAPPHVLDAVLARLAGDYDLVIIDCPPGIKGLQIQALVAVHYVIIPTKDDRASLEGLEAVAALFGQVRAEHNPDLDLLGVLLFGVEPQARKIARETREYIGELLGVPDAQFLTTVRHVARPANDCRKLGKLARELTRELYAGQPVPASLRFSPSAPGLAADYEALATEVADRMVARAEVPA